MTIKYTPIFGIVVLGMVLFTGATSAEAFEKSDGRYKIAASRVFDLKYEIYAGGFDVMTAHLVYNLKPQTYDLALDAHTQGFIGDLFPWKGSYTTAGHPDKNVMPVPTKHVASTTWKKTLTEKQMDYDASGNLLKLTTVSKGDTKVKTDTKEELYKGSVDLLTGMLMMTETIQRNEKCEGSYPVFDGKRRFDITLHDDGYELLPKSKYSKFVGEALRCTIKVVPVGGFEKKDQKRGWMAVQAHTEERKKPPTIWFGRMQEGTPLLPVRMEIASAYGSVVANLVNKPAAKK